MDKAPNVAPDSPPVIITGLVNAGSISFSIAEFTDLTISGSIFSSASFVKDVNCKVVIVNKMDELRFVVKKLMFGSVMV